MNDSKATNGSFYLNNGKKLHYFNKYEEKLNHKYDLHPKLVKSFNTSYPSELQQLSKHIIFYGPSGVGKYSLALKLIRRYSKSKLRYEKKIMISSNKTIFAIKISDIHYEIDMSTLGCNAKVLWHDTFIQLIDTITLKKETAVIILCKCFHETNIELLEILYSYVQQMNNKMCFSVDIKFIFLTEHLSFIPDNILTCCEVVNVSRPTLNRYHKCIEGSITTSTTINNISNHIDKNVLITLNPLIHICSPIITFLKDSRINIKLISLRDYVYDILVYNLNIHDCLWYIIENIDHVTIDHKTRIKMIMLVYGFFRYYNNNYRPIYHFEWLLINLYRLLHKLI